MHPVNPQLFTDHFDYELPGGRKRKHPSGATGTKRRKRKRPTQKKTSTKAPKLHLTEEQKRERKRVLANENSQRRKELGLCKSCPNIAIEGQTRCQDCAEKHRAWSRQYSENRRRAQGMKPRRRIDDTELKEQLRHEIAEQENQETEQQPKRVRREAYKQEQREKQASLRAERASLGLCRDCGKFRVEGQTRCSDCVLRHRQYLQRAKAKVTVLNEIRQVTASGIA